VGRLTASERCFNRMRRGTPERRDLARQWQRLVAYTCINAGHHDLCDEMRRDERLRELNQAVMDAVDVREKTDAISGVLAHVADVYGVTREVLEENTVERDGRYRPDPFYFVVPVK